MGIWKELILLWPLERISPGLAPRRHNLRLCLSLSMQHWACPSPLTRCKMGGGTGGKH